MTNEQRLPLTMEIQLRDGILLQEQQLREKIEEFFSMRTLSYEERELSPDDLSPELASLVASIRITDLQNKSEIEARSTLFWWEIQPLIYFFKSNENGPSEVLDEEESISFLHEWSLPSIEFRAVWENLYYEDDLKAKLLQYIETALFFVEKGVNPEIINWNRVILLHGPPGTGKTSLCKALAQKVAIRLYSKYPSGIRLMEVHAHSLFSKYFSESGKLVSELFEKIEELAHLNDLLLFILMDEVESLTSARQSALNGSEPSDALRAVNALLTHIDRLKRYSNVVLLTTSNITDAIDLAFLDRADIKAYVGPPGLKVRHQILNKCLEELQRAGIVAYRKQECSNTKHTDIVKSIRNELSLEESNPSDLLHFCSLHSENFSCRLLKKLPFLAYASFIPPISLPIPCKSFLEALKLCILKDKQDMGMI